MLDVTNGSGASAESTNSGSWGVFAKLSGLQEQHVLWIALVFGVALLTRSLWVSYATHGITGRRLFDDDALFYQLTADALAKGRGFSLPTGGSTAYFPPGYSLLLACLYFPFGSHAVIAWSLNVVLGALTCVVVYVVGSMLVHRRVGIAAGLLLALSPGHIAFSSVIMSEVLFTFLIAVAMLLILALAKRGDLDWRGALLVGIVIGIAGLVRAQALVFVLVAGIFWFLHSGNWERSLYLASLVWLAAVSVIIPWSIRNRIEMGSFVFLSTNYGENFYIGHHEGATGGYMPGSLVSISSQFADKSPQAREVMTSKAALREGLRFAFTHPGDEMKLTVSKVRKLYEEDAYAMRSLRVGDSGKPEGVVDLLSYLANAFYFLTLGLSAIGAWRWYRRALGGLSLPVLVIVSLTLVQLLFFSLTRYHIPMLPAFALLAGVGLVFLAERVPRFLSAVARSR